MIGFKIGKIWFDPKETLAAVAAQDERIGKRIGAFVWQRARTSLRYRKKPSAPGQPPSVHRRSGFSMTKRNRKTGQESKQLVSPLRELISFAYDRTTRSTVIGPTRGKAEGKVPRILEQGGESEIVVRQGGDLVRKKVIIAPRPYMKPALDKEKSKLPGLWANSIRR